MNMFMRQVYHVEHFRGYEIFFLAFQSILMDSIT